jgi:hypothetical protein
MAWTRAGWSKSWSGVVAFAVVVWALVYFPAGQIAYALQRGNNLTEMFDSYSEAGTIRAGEGYADHGFLYDYGLPDVGYGNAFEGQGGKHDPNLCPTLPCVYLHEPTGTELIIGAMTKMCGKGNVSCLRIAPITIGFLSLLFLAWAATRAMGIQRTAFVFGTFYFVPMVTNGMHNLHYHSHVTALIFVYSGFLLLAFVGPLKDEKWVMAGVCASGFLYGCFAFDYAFHVALLPIAFWLMGEDVRKNVRKVFIAMCLACGGYLFALLLHFIQVRLFLGSWSALIADFTARAAMRMSGHLEATNPVQPPLRLLLIYWTRLMLEPQFLGYSFLGTSAATMALLMAPRDVVMVRRWNLTWAPRPAFKWAFLTAWLIPDVWLMFMRQHASVHGHFLPRNFIVTFTTGAILLALSVRRTATEGNAESSEQASEPTSAAA